MSCSLLLSFGCRRSLAVVLLGILLAVPLLSGCSGEDTNDENLPRLPPFDNGFTGLTVERDEMRLTFDPSDQRGYATVYRVVSPVDEEYARSMAEKFGVMAEPTYVAGDIPELSYYEFESEQSSVVVTMKGEVGFNPPVPSAEDSAAGQISEEEARGKAEHFLSERGLLPEEAEFEKVWPDPQHNKAEVNFHHSALGWSGWGPRISVVVNGSGVIIGVGYYWPILEPMGDYPILSEREAVDSILEGKTLIPFGPCPGTIELSSVELRYKEAFDKESTILVPFYWFQGKDFIWVPAIPDEYILSPDAQTEDIE